MGCNRREGLRGRFVQGYDQADTVTSGIAPRDAGSAYNLFPRRRNTAYNE